VSDLRCRIQDGRGETLAISGRALMLAGCADMAYMVYMYQEGNHVPRECTPPRRGRGTSCTRRNSICARHCFATWNVQGI